MKSRIRIPSRWLLVLIPTLVAARMAVLPFRDQSDFKGPWKLESNVSRYITDHFSKFTEIVPFESVARSLRSQGWRYSDYQVPTNLIQLGNNLNAKYFVTGRITRFYMVKKMVGNGRLGGYKHYNAGIEAKVKLFDTQQGQWVEQFPISIHKRNRGLRLNMPGKLSKDEESFHRLSKESFGSETFKQTVLGKVLDQMCDEILDQVNTPSPAVKDTTKRRPSVLKAFEGRILEIADSLAYINLGFDDNIVIGEHFPVYTNGKPLLDPEKGDTLGYTDKYMGEMEISFIKARHLCTGKMTSGHKVIRVGDRVRIQKP